MKNICLYARAGQNKLYGKIGLILEKKSYKTSYIVQNSKEEKTLVSLNVKGNIYNLTNYIKSNWDNSTKLGKISISEIEKKYKIDSIWRIFYTDRFINKYNYKDAIKFIKLHVLFIEEVYKSENPEFLINENVAIFSSFIFYLTGKLYNCIYLGITAPRLLNENKIAFIIESEYEYYYRFNESYNEANYSQEEFLTAEEFLNKFKKEKIHPHDYYLGYNKPQFKVTFFFKIIRYLLNLVFVKEEKYDYVKNKNESKIISGLKNYLKYQFQKKYFQNLSQSDKYYLFPLQQQPEATTLVSAQDYEKQLYAIDLISKKIPGDSILYVKEHIALIGHREWGFYKKLKNYPNVKLITPWEDSHNLIKKSQGVIVLTSTVGLEAILYNKPVFLLGNVFYEIFKYVYKINNIGDLTKIINNAKNTIIKEEDYKLEVLKFLAAYMKILSDGCYIFESKDTYKEKNINILTNSIISEIIEIEKEIKSVS